MCAIGDVDAGVAGWQRTRAIRERHRVVGRSQSYGRNSQQAGYRAAVVEVLLKTYVGSELQRVRSALVREVVHKLIGGDAAQVVDRLFAVEWVVGRLRMTGGFVLAAGSGLRKLKVKRLKPATNSLTVVGVSVQR